MDTASSPWLIPFMRFSFLAACGLLAFQAVARAQSSTPPVFLTHPGNLTVHIGQPVTLNATVEGATTLQWRKNDSDIPGANTATYFVPMAALTDSGSYHLVATNAFGSAVSTTASVLVTKRPQTISFGSTPSFATAGSSVSITATASSGLPVTLALVSGSGSFTGNVVVGSGPMVIRATQPGNATYAAAEPVDFTINFLIGVMSPFISVPPADQTVTAGTTVTFRASAIGTPAPTFQWQKDGVAIAGATSTTLTLPAVTLADSARYTIVATNLAGAVNASAVLTVRAAPVIVTSPASQTVFAGAPAIFSVQTTGFPAPTYQWRKNGTAIVGATGRTYSIPSAATTDAGRFDVVARNELGTATSDVATLVVNARDFAGQYFGQLSGPAATDGGPGEFALHVRSNRTAVFLAQFPGLPAGVAATNVVVDLNGNFSVNAAIIAATPQSVTLRGSIDDATGRISGTLSVAGLSFEGSRASRTGTAASLAGLYQAAIVGTAAARGHVIVAPSGDTFVLLSSGVAVDSARGVLDTAGRLAATSRTQTTLSLTFASGAITGSIRTSAGAAAPVGGAIEGIAGREHVNNLSVRSLTAPNAPLITGFVITGPGSKQVLIRAAGPTLAQAPFNIAGTIADPTLQVLRGNTTVAQNDNWGTPAANATAVNAAATRAGAFPFRAGSADAAVVTTLPPAAYTVIIGGGNGTTIAEVYEVLENNEAPGARRLVNVSARGLVAPGAPLIAGFAITGTAPQRVLVRGIGPTLAGPPFNVPGALANPVLTLFRGTTALKANDDWFRDPDAVPIRDASARAGAFALGASSLDAAMVLFLEPGSYTVQVSGPPNVAGAAATGIALVEVYEATLTP